MVVNLSDIRGHLSRLSALEIKCEQVGDLVTATKCRDASVQLSQIAKDLIVKCKFNGGGV